MLAAAAAGGSEGAAANAPKLIEATGVPVLEALEQCSTLADAAAVALRAWGYRTLQAGVLGGVLHLLERRSPSKVRCALVQQRLTVWKSCRLLASPYLSSKLDLALRLQGGVGSGEPGCAPAAAPCPSVADTPSFAAHAGRTVLESAPFQAQRLLPWWFAASTATIVCSVLKVCTAVREPTGCQESRVHTVCSWHCGAAALRHHPS